MLSLSMKSFLCFFYYTKNYWSFLKIHLLTIFALFAWSQLAPPCVKTHKSWGWIVNEEVGSIFDQLWTNGRMNYKALSKTAQLTPVSPINMSNRVFGVCRVIHKEVILLIKLTRSFPSRKMIHDYNHANNTFLYIQ